MRLTLENYEGELMACKATIEEMEGQYNLMASKNKQLEKNYKDVCKELEFTKRELKVVFDSSKHRKPKRESSVLKRERDNFSEESTVIKIFADCSTQTEFY
jgi:chromosome segregation ATPase